MYEDREQLEYAISQYIDGTLSPAEHEALEIRLREDPEAATLLREYRDLDVLLKTPVMVPNFNWDALAEQISSNIDEEEEQASPVIFRIGWGRVASYAAAACLVIAGAIAAIVLTQNRPAAPRQAVAQVSGPSAEQGSGPKVMQIAIGPGSDSMARLDNRAAQAILVRDSSVVIQSDAPLYAENYRGNPFD